MLRVLEILHFDNCFQNKCWEYSAALTTGLRRAFVRFLSCYFWLELCKPQQVSFLSWQCRNCWIKCLEGWHAMFLTVSCVHKVRGRATICSPQFPEHLLWAHNWPKVTTHLQRCRDNVQWCCFSWCASLAVVWVDEYLPHDALGAAGSWGPSWSCLKVGQ